MDGLILRLSRLDPEAGAAVRVISYFDVLTEQGTGLQGIVRAAALLTGSTAGLLDDQRHVGLRVNPEGRCERPAGPPSPSWLSTGVDDSAVLWLERDGPARTVDEVTLERAGAAARAILTRTRGRSASRRTDEADQEILLDPAASATDRALAARRLRLDDHRPTRVLAVHGSSPLVQQLPNPPAQRERPTASTAELPDLAHRRVGIGPWVALLELPASFADARQALRFTAHGGDDDPGPRVVHADDLGGLLLLAACITPDSPPPPDTLAIEHARAVAPWMLSTLHALTVTASLRAAAAHLGIHHSTLHDRVGMATRALGWDPTTPSGGHRLHLALAIRRLQSHLM